MTVVDGKLILQWIQNASQYTISCDVRIDDGQLHTLTIGLNNTKISFKIDHHKAIHHDLIKEDLVKFRYGFKLCQL